MGAEVVDNGAFAQSPCDVLDQIATIKKELDLLILLPYEKGFKLINTLREKEWAIINLNHRTRTLIDTLEQLGVVVRDLQIDQLLFEVAFTQSTDGTDADIEEKYKQLWGDSVTLYSKVKRSIETRPVIK